MTRRLLAVAAIAMTNGCAFVPSRPLPAISATPVGGLSAPASREMGLQNNKGDQPTDSPVVQVFPVAVATLSETVGEDREREKSVVIYQTRRVDVPPVDIWDRMRRSFAMPPLDGAVAEQFARHFAKTGFLDKTQIRARRYLFYFLGEIERRGLPAELALLPFVESAMNPLAVSRANAVGFWQFIPATGKRYMRVSHLVDDRKGVAESTRGAIDYLSALYAQFGDWHLALASYNWGENAVARSIERNKARSLPTDYSSLSMPAETRSYVPQLEGLKRLILDPDRYGALLPEIPNEPYFRAVAVARDMDVDLALRFAGIHESEFFALNPSVSRPLLIAAATPKLLLPHDAAERFEVRLTAHTGPVANWTVVRLGEKTRLETIAEQYGISARQLRQINRIPPEMKATAGSSLIVPKAGGANVQVAGDLVETSYLGLSPELTRIFVKARKGETLRGMAKRLGLKTADLERWNVGVPPQTRFKHGQKVIAYVNSDAARPSMRNQQARKQTRSG